VNGSTIDKVQAATHETVRRKADATLHRKLRLSNKSALEESPSRNEANVKKASI